MGGREAPAGPVTIESTNWAATNNERKLLLVSLMVANTGRLKPGCVHALSKTTKNKRSQLFSPDVSSTVFPAAYCVGRRTESYYTQ